MVGHDVPKKTHGKREYPGEMADDFDDEKQRRKHKDGPKKMSYIFYTVGLDSIIMSGEENHQGAGHGRIQIVRWGEEARDKSEKIGEEDEES